MGISRLRTLRSRGDGRISGAKTILIVSVAVAVGPSAAPSIFAFASITRCRATRLETPGARVSCRTDTPGKISRSGSNLARTRCPSPITLKAAAIRTPPFLGINSHVNLTGSPLLHCTRSRTFSLNRGTSGGGGTGVGVGVSRGKILTGVSGIGVCLLGGVLVGVGQGVLVGVPVAVAVAVGVGLCVGLGVGVGV